MVNLNSLAGIVLSIGALKHQCVVMEFKTVTIKKMKWTVVVSWSYWFGEGHGYGAFIEMTPGVYMVQEFCLDYIFFITFT